MPVLPRNSSASSSYTPPGSVGRQSTDKHGSSQRPLQSSTYSTHQTGGVTSSYTPQRQPTPGSSSSSSGLVRDRGVKNSSSYTSYTPGVRAGGQTSVPDSLSASPSTYTTSSVSQGRQGRYISSPPQPFGGCSISPSTGNVPAPLGGRSSSTSSSSQMRQPLGTCPRFGVSSSSQSGSQPLPPSTPSGLYQPRNSASRYTPTIGMSSNASSFTPIAPLRSTASSGVSSSAPLKQPQRAGDSRLPLGDSQPPLQSLQPLGAGTSSSLEPEMSLQPLELWSSAPSSPAPLGGSVAGDSYLALGDSRPRLQPLQPASTQPEPWEKDQKLVELLQLATMSGLGDLDPEQASGLLEAIGWDVPEALSRLCGGARHDTAIERHTVGRRRGSGNIDGDLAGFELLRMQEEEYTRSFERQAHHRNRRHQADITVWDEEIHEDLDDGDSGLPSVDLLHDFPEHFDNGIQGTRSRARADRDDNSAERFLEAAMRRQMNAMAFENGILDSEEEALHLHALMNVLIRSQDEADLQDALRRSSDEAYSGGFSAPPAEEETIQKVTSTSQFCEGDPKGQCSICLMDFEVGDSLRTMQCSHRFHMACIDQWLAQSGQCAVCKKQVGMDH